MRNTKNVLIKFFKDDKIYVKINNVNYPIVGRIGMNHITVDITNSDVKIGDEVSVDVSPIFVNSKIRREYI